MNQGLMDDLPEEPALCPAVEPASRPAAGAYAALAALSHDLGWGYDLGFRGADRLRLLLGDPRHPGTRALATIYIGHY